MIVSLVAFGGNDTTEEGRAEVCGEGSGGERCMCGMGVEEVSEERYVEGRSAV